MRPEFIGAIGLIAGDLDHGRALYVRSLGLPLREAPGGQFLFTTKLGGGRYFGVWPLSGAAQTCFGSPEWPADRPVPQMFIEFELSRRADVAVAAAELEREGYRLVHGARTDPWGQTVARLQTKDGVIVGISYVPWMHRTTRRPSARRPRSPRRSGRAARPRGSAGRRRRTRARAKV